MMSLQQMRKISIIWGAFLIIIVILLTALGFVYKNKSNEYKEVEKKLVDASKKYVDAKFLYPEEKKSIKIRLEEMKEDEFIDALQKDEDFCDGYVLVTHNGTVFEYNGYIKCSNYTTKGFEE